jgi:hypothetical protein
MMVKMTKNSTQEVAELREDIVQHFGACKYCNSMHRCQQADEMEQRYVKLTGTATGLWQPEATVQPRVA